MSQRFGNRERRTSLRHVEGVPARLAGAFFVDPGAVSLRAREGLNEIDCDRDAPYARPYGRTGETPIVR